MSALTEIIAGEIRERGSIPFTRFMDLALYHPEHGYYASGQAVVGRMGDFFTNVSVGPLYGKLLARQFIELWERLGRPAEFVICEQGAHGGEFAGDVLAAISEFAPACFAATRYTIIEPSVALAKRQRERLAPFGAQVRHYSRLEDLPRFIGVHFSNELVDAFPVHVVRWTGAEWREQYVGREGEQFVFCEGAFSSPELTAAVGHIPLPLPPGYTTEVNLAAPLWLEQVAARLERGAVLLVDYGYLREEFFAPHRSEGTLSAYARHQRQSDPLAHPGAQDLTAHVEFTTLMEQAGAYGLDVCGYTDQHHFMVGLGMDYFGEDGGEEKERRAFQTLMHPQFMGLAFKVLGLSKGMSTDKAWTGFRFARSLPAAS